MSRPADAAGPEGSRRGFPARIANLALTAATAVAIFGVALRLAGSDRLPWPGPSVLAFTPYGIPAVVALALVAAIARRWRVVGLLGAAAIVLLAIVVPRTVAREQPVVGREARTVRVMTANVLRSRADPVRLVALVRAERPDVLSLQEATPAFVAALRRAGIDAFLPRRVAQPGNRFHDTALFSRWPIVRPPSTLPSVYLTTLVVAPGGPPIPVISAHPMPPISPAGQQRWRRWLAALPGPNAPYAGGIVAGDFNATLDHAEFRRLLDAGWRDAGREAGSGFEPTWHGLPGARLTLDHVLVAPGTAVRSYTVRDLAGSDHRAVSVTLALPAKRSRTTVGLGKALGPDERRALR